MVAVYNGKNVPPFQKKQFKGIPFEEDSFKFNVFSQKAKQYTKYQYNGTGP